MAVTGAGRTWEPSTCTGSASSGVQVSSLRECGKVPLPEGQAAQQLPRITLPGRSSMASSVDAQHLDSRSYWHVIAEEDAMPTGLQQDQCS